MAEAVPAPLKSVFVVHYSSPTESLPNVFIASDEDYAISYCLHWTGLFKFSKEPEWQLRIYERALDDIHTDWQNIVTIFDQDGFTVDVPDIDISGICRQIGQTDD
jgi:hypothetical protein